MLPGWLLALAFAAQQPAEPFRGVLLEWDGDARGGQLSVRSADFRVHVFLFDRETLLQREGRAVGIAALAPGDTLEVVCDSKDRSLRPYAKTVRVLIPAKHRAAPAVLAWPAPEPGGDLFIRGSLVVAGLVTEAQPDYLRLRVRNGGKRVVLLRQDTRWLRDGVTASPVELRINTHVFIRAGRAPEGGLEAYQVVWGRILRVP